MGDRQRKILGSSPQIFFFKKDKTHVFLKDNISADARQKEFFNSGV